MPTISASREGPVVLEQMTGMRQPSGSGPGTRRKVNLAGTLRKHRLLTLFVAVVVIAAGVPAAWLLGAPKYSATFVIYVSPRFLSNLGEGGEQKFESATQYRDYVQQNVRTINRFDIVLEALKRIGPLRSVWMKPQETLERAATRLQGALVVEQVPDTYQITATLESPNREGLAELVNAIAAVYLERAKSEEFYASDQRVDSLVQDRTRVQAEIEAEQAKRVELAQELGVSSFTDNYLNPYDRLLVAAKEAEAEARKDAIQAEAQLAAFDDTQRAGGTDALNAYALDQASKDPTLASLMTNLNSRRAQILASLSGLSPEHPGRRAADRELAEIEKERQFAYQRLVDSFSKMMMDQRRADSFKADRAEQRLTDEVRHQESQAASFTRAYQEGIQLGADIDRARKRYDSIEQRLEFFSMEKGAPGYVRLFSAARAPDLPVKGGRKKLFGIFVLIGFAMALVVPVGVDFFDPRIHSPADTEGILGFPLIGWLMEKKQAGPEFSREQILRLANRIAQDQQSNGSRIFAFTSVKAGGGTSSSVLETAAALGRLGVPALAVEANAYRADPRYRRPDSRGLTVLLTANQSLESELVPGDDEMPDRVPVGDIRDEKNLPDIQNLLEVLRQATLAYRVVLVDIPPILVSVDAEFIAGSADVVVLVIEAESVTRAELIRSARSLERIKVPAVSALLNRVRGIEANGFADAALAEFQNGAAPAPSRWIRPWLW